MLDVEEAAEYFVNNEFTNEVSEFVLNRSTRIKVYYEILVRFGNDFAVAFNDKFPSRF